MTTKKSTPRARWKRRLSSMMSSSSRTLRVITSRHWAPTSGLGGPEDARRPRAGSARDAGPEGEVDLGAGLGEALGVLAVVLGEFLLSPARAWACSAGLLVVDQAPGHLSGGSRPRNRRVRSISADRLLRRSARTGAPAPARAGSGRTRGGAAGSSGRARCVAHDAQEHAIAALLGEPVQPGDRRAVAGDGVAQHDQQLRLGGRLRNSGDPEVRHVTRRPLAGEPARGRGNSDAYSAAMSSGAFPCQKRSK